MTTRYLAAAIQLSSTEDKATNLATATRLVEDAASQGAKLVVLPELFNCLGRFEVMVEQAEPIPGPTSEKMRELAARLAITLVAGSICEHADEPRKGYNTSLVFDPTGKQIARYRKIHLFDVELGDEVRVRESDWIHSGNEIVATRTEIGFIGQAICYDLRFPELFRALVDREMQVLAFPSAFTAPTGEAHWDVLLRARAIENQVYVVGANQYGQHTLEFSTYGHSAIVDPWGKVLASAEDGDNVVIAEIDLKRLAEIRDRLPALEHRRVP